MAAQAPELQQALEQHAEENEGQKERLERVFDIGKSARSRAFESIRGLMAESEGHIEEFKGSEAADSVLISGAQAMEHCEIARYGTLKTGPASQLALDDAVKLLDQTLQEEKKTDDLLTKTAQAATRSPSRS